LLKKAESPNDMAQILFKSWHQTVDWGDPITVLNSMPMGFPELVGPAPLDEKMQTDVLSICDTMNEGGEAMRKSVEALFRSAREKFIDWQTESDPADFSWVETLQPVP